jgi:hypothetical protein
MYSARRSILAVTIVLVSSLSGTVAFPQTVKFMRHAADPLSLANLPIGRAPCTRDSGSAVSAPKATAPAIGDAESPCDTPPVSVPSVNPCNPASAAQIGGCNARRDPVQEDLATMGKTGQKILRARERVLEILQSENACSAWFREKDSNPADAFRTLNFEIDNKGEEVVVESKGADGTNIFRNPYVARVFQGDGRYGRITINTKGTFFSPIAMVIEAQSEGRPWISRGVRSLGVGPYGGDSMHAQVLTLLHEFGHLVDLLPTDEGDLDGKSARNTGEVLQFCRAEIESKVRRGTFSAAR